MWPLRKTPVRINLALQGGGAHGAFTWGVLDALLEQAPFEVGAVSAASAGAMNAVALAHGLAEGGRDGARAALDRLWTAIGSQLPFEWFTTGDGPDLALAPAAQALLQWTRLLAPAQWNPLDLNPLREILRRQIDFERLRGRAALPLFIAATHANSGQLRLFGNARLDTEVLLASSCLPTLHRAVMIDGEPYWDGAFAANPALFPLVFDAAADDTLLVLLAPLRHADTPRSVADIQARMADIAFNNTFLREARLLADIARRTRGRWWQLGHLERCAARARWHLIDGHESLVAFRRETRLVAHLPFLQHLRDAGRAQALTWLHRDGAQVGRRSSIDLQALFGQPSGSAPP